MSGAETYEVFALKYGSRADRTRRDFFLLAPRPDEIHPIDYYFWVIRNDRRTIVVDTGLDPTSAARLGRAPFYEPAAILRDFGVEPAEVETLILSHLHYDHIGATPAFARARIHMQAAEIAFATGPQMVHDYLRFPYEAVQIGEIVSHIHAGRVTFHDGDGEIAPGITVHRMDGHAIGMQAVRVATARGHVVLASDAAPWAEH